jgi:ABC-type nitrate/sulfonate/bicarbonate transport system substrate-binding protein
VIFSAAAGVDQKLVVAPGINDYADLKGKIFAVDAPTTGYAIVGVYIMKKHGLEWNRDYTFKSFGNTTARANAMSKGDAAGAMMSLSNDEIQKRGFKVLAKSEDYVKHYARGLGATRRVWATP